MPQQVWQNADESTRFAIAEVITRTGGLAETPRDERWTNGSPRLLIPGRSRFDLHVEVQLGLVSRRLVRWWL